MEAVNERQTVDGASVGERGELELVRANDLDGSALDRVEFGKQGWRATSPDWRHILHS